MNASKNFIVIEGLDGSGKSTQLKLIREYLEKHDRQFKDIHFPKMNEGYYGKLVAEFLRGEFGSIEQVDPKIVALLFAGDRKEHIHEVNQWLKDGFVVIADRYVNSNIAFQCAKMKDRAAKDRLKAWILDFEYGYHQLPRPSVSMFLDVPLESIKRSLATERKGEDRDYLNGKRDIHEDSLQLQVKVRQEYLTMVEEQEDFHLIKCYDDKGNYLPPLAIHEEVRTKLEELNIFA